MCSSIRNGRHQPAGCWIRPVKRLAIYLRDGFVCVYCGRDLTHAHAHDVTLDHLEPRSNGGDNHESNLVTACKSCNCARGDRALKAWVANPVHRRKIRQQARRKLGSYTQQARAIMSGSD